jgi:hypothetical protein
MNQGVDTSVGREVLEESSEVPVLVIRLEEVGKHAESSLARVKDRKSAALVRRNATIEIMEAWVAKWPEQVHVKPFTDFRRYLIEEHLPEQLLDEKIEKEADRYEYYADELYLNLAKRQRRVTPLPPLRHIHGEYRRYEQQNRWQRVLVRGDETEASRETLRQRDPNHPAQSPTPQLEESE